MRGAEVSQRESPAPLPPLHVAVVPTVRPRPHQRWAPLFDLMLLAVAGLVATAAGPRGLSAGHDLLAAGAYAIGVCVALQLRRFYRVRLVASPIDDLARIVTATATAAMVLIAARVLLEGMIEPARHALRLWVFGSIYLCGGRLGMMLASRRLYQRGRGARGTLIIGAGTVGTLIAQRLLERPELGLRPVGFLDKNPRIDAVADLGVPVLGTSADLERVVHEHRVSHVILAFSTAPHAVSLQLIRRARQLGVDVSVIPRLFEHMTSRLTIEHLGGIPLVYAQQVNPHSWQFTLKYALGRVLAGVLIVLFAPLLMLIALGVRRSSPGPALYTQRRVGRDGHVFDILKFRTMRGLPEGEAFVRRTGVAPGGVEGDDRRTAFGQLLRRYSLDELPQLFNVVKGDMTLVGPRPERPEFVAEFELSVYRYGDRHRVKSGLTGWAQVQGLRGQTSLRDRVEWDNYYIENWSLWLDLKIMFLTIAAVLHPRNAE